MLNEQQRNVALYELLGHASEGMAKAAQIRESQHRQAQEIEALIPDTLNALVAGRVIEPGQVTKYASYLRNPGAALELLKLAAERRGTSKASLGTTYKTASAAGQLSSRELALQKADEAFYADLGTPNF